MILDIQVVKAEEFDVLEVPWKKLEKGTEMTAFQLFDWYKNINQLYLKEKFLNHFRECIYVLAVENGEVVMIAPIQIIKVGVNIYYKNVIGQNSGIYLIGRNGYSDYLNFIYDDFSEEAASLIFSFLEGYSGYHLCYFDMILESTKLYRFICEKYRLINQISCYCAELILPEKFEVYSGRLSKKMRQNIRTALNRQKKNNMEFSHKLIEDVDSSIVDSLYKIREQRLGKKRKDVLSGVSMAGRVYLQIRRNIRKHLCSTHDVLRENCNPWSFLVIDEHTKEIAGYFWGIKNVYQKTYYVILAGVNTKYAWYSPSISHFYSYLQELYQNNMNTEIYSFDFTRGGEKYKHDIGAEKKDAYTVYFDLKQ